MRLVWLRTATCAALLMTASAALAVDIVVTTTLDFAEADSAGGNEDRYTCGYEPDAIFVVAPNGECTFRRAILEAGVRPDGDRPINIIFDLMETDPNYDAQLDMWEVQVDSSFVLEIDRRFFDDDGGQVTIDGDTQTGGRTSGPKIIVNTNSENNELFGRSLEVRTSNNTIQNIGFRGGGQIILYADGNTVQNVWMGLTNDGSEMALASTASSQAQRSMARGGIIMPNSASDNNVIRNNRIIGASERAIRVTSGGSGNMIVDNFIGMNADGEVPVGGDINCFRDSDYDSGLWYGGRGIQVTGSNNTIEGNTLAGLHVTQSENETPPISMEIAGTNNSIQNNIVGLDANGAEVGVCGQGLLLQGDEGVVTNNVFFHTRNGFDPNDVGTDFDAAIIMQSYEGTGAGDWMRVWDNLIDGGNRPTANFHAYRFSGPGVPIEMRQFIPSKITSINGMTVSGENGDPLPMGPSTDCPNCTIYLYADDLDDRIEMFELIGTATADANGDWTTTLDRPLTAAEGIRTQSMSNDRNAIHIYDALNTTRLSDDLYRPVLEEVIYANGFEGN
ncbi:MAG: hypothetical protein AAGA23_09495 [Pseudomonadota bacterium]